MSTSAGGHELPISFAKHHTAHLVALLGIGALQLFLLAPATGPQISGGDLLFVVLSAALLWVAIPFAVWRATALEPKAPEAHWSLRWLLELPGRLSWRTTFANVLGAAVLPVRAVLATKVTPGTALEVALLGFALCLLIATVSMLCLEDALRPVTIEALAAELERLKDTVWNHAPTLTLLLPLVVFSSAGAAFFLAVLAMSGVAHVASTVLALVLIVGLAGWSVRLLIERNDAALDVLDRSVARLGSSLTPTLWMSGDEAGRVMLTLQRAHEKSANQTYVLRHAGILLHRSVSELSQATVRQNEMLSTQSAAIQETSATATEIKQTSLLASQKASEVLILAEKAEESRRLGEEAVERSLGGLTDIGLKVQAMAEQVRLLDGQLRQVATITTLVKDLADQSNMLALNAAIEAARAGEQGRGFAVVSREIRSLADQSIQATQHVQRILTEISDAARAAVAITESGRAQVSTSLSEVQASRENIRRLSSIVHENAAAVRQIAGAVNQQNAGVAQIFEAVHSLSEMMHETLRHLETSKEAISLVQSVSEDVMQVVQKRSSDVDTDDEEQEEMQDEAA